jgi:FkbM family methyltransferase
MKKLIIRLLCNAFIGRIISVVFNYNIPDCRAGFKRFKTPKEYCNDTVRAMIFWGFYESAKLRLIKKYLPSNIPVIELGASLGILSSTAISCLNMETSYVCIEANPYLKEYIDFNIKRYNPQKENYAIINAAIAYKTNGFINMNISNNNTESSITTGVESSSYKITKVNAISLKDIVNIEFTLICDIEGAEIEVFLNDSHILQNCKHLFVELHRTNYEGKLYEVFDLQKILTSDLGFSLVCADGNSFYYNR